MIVNDNKKILYGAVPKVANTNFRRVFLGLNGVVPKDKVKNISGYDVYGVHSDKIKTIAKLPKKDQEKRLETYRKFTFVREPLERLLSGYRNKFFHPNQAHRDVFYDSVKRYYEIHQEKRNQHRMRTSFLRSPITFKEFVTYIIDCFDTNEIVNEHFLPQYILLKPCKVSYDFIGKYETLDRDFKFIFQQLGIDLRFPDRQDNYSSVSTSSLVEAYYSELPSDMLQAILNILLPDYTLFGYRIPTWVQQTLQNRSDVDVAG